MQQTIAGQAVDVNVECYMTDMNQWNGEIAKELATGLGVPELTEKHWAVLNWLREQQANGVEVNIHKVGNSGIYDIKEFYQLFPNGSLKNASKIAGLPKPTSCL
jgi:dissimilatory sulfite reductase related protein